jgi:hypothetical protein
VTGQHLSGHLFRSDPIPNPNKGLLLSFHSRCCGLVINFSVVPMKIPLIAPLAVVSLFFAACGHKSTQITSSSPAPSPTSLEAEEPQDNSAVSSSLVAEESPKEQAVPSPSPSGSSGRPVFKSKATTQLANQYLDSYQTLVNDLNTVSTPPPGDLEASMSYLKSYTQKLARDSAVMENQKRQVQSQLSPDERKRLLQYKKSLEQVQQEDQ